MTTYHHRVKTHAGWQVHQPIPGIYLWQSPHGSIFLVDHTGTRQLRRPHPTGQTTSSPTPPTETTAADADSPVTAHPHSPLEQQLERLVTAA